MKKPLFLILVVIIMLNITSCNKKTDEIVIGLNYEGSGALAPYGRAMLEGTELAVAEINAAGGINGRLLRLEKADNRSVGAESAAAVLYLCSVKKADVIIGPATSTLAKAALAANADTLIISPSATADELTASGEMVTAENKVKGASADIFFENEKGAFDSSGKATATLGQQSHGAIGQKTAFVRICFSDSVQGSAMGEYANGQGFSKAAVLVDMSSDYSVGCANAFRESFSGEIVFEGRFFSGDTDFSVLVTELARSGADCVYLPAYYTEAGLIIRLSREQGITTAFLGGDAMDSPYLLDVIGKNEYAKNITYTDHFTPDSERYLGFARAFEERFGTAPPAYAALAYDSVMLYCNALKKNIQSVEKEIYNTRGYQGVTGEITVKENGDCDKQPVFVSPRN